MVAKNSQQLANRVCHVHEKVFFRDRKKTRQHFLAEGMHRTTINRILDRYEERGNADFKKKIGRPAILGSPQLVKSLKDAITKNPNVSNRCMATKLGISEFYVRYIKAKKLGFKTYKAQSAPKYNEGQKSRAKTNCRKIGEKMLKQSTTKMIVMDDETYCPIDPESINGVKYYSCANKKNVQAKYKFKSKEKFPQKYLIWLALDETGKVSKPFITTKTLNSKLYLKECIMKRLIPFIENKDVLFWPDMATSHYAKIVTDALREQKVDFVEKKDNAPNVPQARPIERFWALIKKEYSKRQKLPKNFRGFAQVMRGIIKRVAETSGEALMASCRKKLRSIGRNGVY